ncbi:Beta-hexosaminidase subunit alpha/beta [Penicillium paradoxum]|uniref:Beta-hexosaminidase subunit alpha/beta n=1 Tax=Penicillium paradoxum TaxID=176176 RepID=UPI0025482CD2|nr:Beta-hexosaminidase subunit alpha/beta [Penicillium paradoxum]KAJ5772732.1 Beta-hexosaminidase subunit alpha/beta [Penicillium paradoxum]
MRILPLLYLVGRVAAVWPAPQSLTKGNSTVWLAEDFRVSYNNEDIPQSTGADESIPTISSVEIIKAAVQRTRESIFTSSIVPWKFHPRNELDQFEPPSSGKAKTYIRRLQITQTTEDSDSTFKPLAGAIDETYNLTIGLDGAASIVAASSTGVLRALETFTQLFYSHSIKGVGVYSNLVPVHVHDEPKFGYRGLDLDVSRNWYPKEHILRTIDALSWNKFNRLHLHMTDAQSWPLDVPALPELSKEGAYGAGLSYTPQDIEDIQVYGVYRGIEVIIEIDMPGHTTSVGFSHPELITAFRQEPWQNYCSEPPCGQLKLNSTLVHDFVTTLLNDILPRVSPYSAYFHTGGDEIDTRDHLLDDTVKSDDVAVLAPLLQKFVDHAHGLVRKAGLVPIVWEELVLDWNITLGDDVIVQTWIDDKSLDEVTARGHKALFGDNPSWYLACGHGKWFNFDNADTQANYPYTDFCSPINNWRVMYEYDPTASLSAAQAKLVVGGEVHLFSEQTDPSNLDPMIWPRTSAAGEVMWSGRQDSRGQNRSQIDAAVRLSELRERMVLRGVNLAPVQMAYCTQYDGDCTW